MSHKLKVLLVDPQGGTRGLNIGLAYIAGALTRKGYFVQVLDYNNTISNIPFKNFLLQYKPDVIGYSIKTATYKSSITLMKVGRSLFPNILQIAGGPHVTVGCKEFMKENREYIDIAVLGEGEETFVELCEKLEDRKSWKDIKGIAYYNEDEYLEIGIPRFVSNLNSLPFPNFEVFIPKPKEMLSHSYPLITSRGCPYNCIYCCVRSVSGNKWRHRRVDNIIEELKNAKKKYDINRFEIYDDNFNLKPEYVISFCERLIKENIRIKWDCCNGLRANSVTRELAFKMKEAGCEFVSIGIESVDRKVFNNIRKGETLNDIIKAIDCFREAKMPTIGLFIIGLPYDDFNKVRRSYEFVKRQKLLTAHFNMLTIYPGTELWKFVHRYGRIIRDYREGSHFGVTPVVTWETPGFSEKERVTAYKMIHTKLGRFDLLIPQTLNPWLKRLKFLLLMLKYDRETLYKIFLNFFKQRLETFLCIK
jgi:radical SAM superfamily enzyme YgiQ (UPF0313 family)